MPGAPATEINGAGRPPPVACVFCEILRGRQSCHEVHSDAGHVAFLDRYPIDLGHLLVVPRRHYERITDMPGPEVARLFELVPRVARAALRATGASGFSIAQNNGRDARQIVPHVHVHVIPRYRGRGAVWTGRRITGDGELESLASKIRSQEP